MTLIAYAVIAALIAGSVFAVWKSHKEAKAERRLRERALERQRFDSFMRAQSESRERIHRPDRRAS